MSDETIKDAVLHDAATEAPYSGKYYDSYEDGTYHCGSCGALLFNSDTKFESKEPGLMGWPSFDQAVEGAVTLRADVSGGMKRTEAVCAKCGGHLGHMFHANDAKTGRHFCINSAALDFQKDETTP